jgi:hypothetical protein
VERKSPDIERERQRTRALHCLLSLAVFFSVRRASDRRALHTRRQQDRLPRLQVRPKMLLPRPRFTTFLIYLPQVHGQQARIQPWGGGQR